MGNSQSSSQNNANTAQRRPIKPKTKTDSPSIPPKAAASPVSVCSKYADLGFSRVRQLRSQVSSPTKSACGSRFPQDGDEDLSELAAQLQVRLSSLSRSNSIASQKSPANQKSGSLATMRNSSTLTTTQDAVDKDTAMKILKEVRKSASPADLAALRKSASISYLSFITSASQLIPLRELLEPWPLESFPCRSASKSPPADQATQTRLSSLRRRCLFQIENFALAHQMSISQPHSLAVVHG